MRQRRECRHRRIRHISQRGEFLECQLTALVKQSDTGCTDGSSGRFRRESLAEFGRDFRRQ